MPFATPVVLGNPEASVAGGIAHLSGLVSWIFGPLLLHALATPGTVARREAARAFNFQFVAGLACIVVAVVAGVLLPESLMGVIMTLGWSAGWRSRCSAAQALSGQAAQPGDASSRCTSRTRPTPLRGTRPGPPALR